MTDKYECHITLAWSPEKNAIYQRVADEMGWRTSWINGDPVLGEKRFFYLTCYMQDAQKLAKKMEDAYDRLGSYGCPALRLKIEEIILDIRPQELV